MAFVSKFTGPEIDRRLAQGTYDDAVAAGFTGTKEQFDAWIAAYTPQEMEKLNNKQDKEDPMLETENKTVVGAINLLNSEKQDKEDERLATESKIVVDAINELNTRTTDLYYNKQDKEDSGLVTEQKTIVGAINELRLKLQDQDSQKQDKVDNGFATNDKSVVGAVNEIHNELDTCVADYNEHIDEYEIFKANTENTLNSHSTQISQLTQEKQDKTDFNLATKSKTVVDAINENHATITAEVARSIAEDARLEEVKVSYTDISDDTNPDRKTIMLKNHDSLSGYGTDGTTAYNLAMVSKWDKADFGAAGIPINLNGSEAHPTYNDKEELAFVSELSGETGKLAEDIKTLNETVATVKQDLADNVSAINKNMEDGFNTINDDIDNEIRPAIEKNTKDIGVVNSTLTTKINETEEKLQADINYLKPRVTTLESLQIVKVDSDSETYSASYELQDATGKVYGQRINIATDKFIKSVSYANQVLTIVFVLEDGSEYSQNIDVSELMNVYTAGGGITITETGVVSVSDDTLQMIQYSDSEVRRLEKDKIPYAYDEKTQSNINVILPEGGSYLGNYGDENATVAKAAVYDGTKQLELGSSKVHTNINTDSDVTIETSTGKKTIATTDELVNVVNIPIRSLQDKVYTQEEIFDWFGVTSIPELKQKISRGSQMYLRYGILLSGNPMYYKMPIEYTAFESANQIKLVFVGLNTRDDVASKYEILINLDGTVIEGNSNIKVTITSIEPEDIDLSGYATKEELNDYALKSEIPDVSDFVIKEEVPNVFETKGLTELETGESSANIEAALGIDFTSLIEIIRENKTIIVDRNSAGDYKSCIHATGNISGGNGAANLMFFIGTTPTIYQVQYVNGTFALAVDEYEFATKDEIPSLDGYVTETALNEKGYLTSVPEEYITESELTAKNYATKSEIPDISGLATKAEVTEVENSIPDISNLATKNEVEQVRDEIPDISNLASKDEIPDISGLATKSELEEVSASIPDVSEFVKESELPKQYIVEEGAALQAGDEQHEFNIKSGGRVTINSNHEVVTYTPYPGEAGRKMLVLANNDSLTGEKTDKTGAPLIFMSKWDKIEVGNSTTPLNLNSTNGEITVNDDKVLATVDQLQAPYEINLTNLLSAEDSESISTAIGGIDNLNATVQDNRIIVGTISNGSVSVSIRILGNITTLYYLLDSVLGLTLNEIAITNTSGALSKSVITHSVLTENMVINSLNSDETTLPLSAAQGKALNSKIDSIDVSADITNAINALDASGQSADTGEVISSVSQENGVVSVSKKTLVSDDIPELPQSKIIDLGTALADKQNATDDTLNTENKTIVGAINEILPKATGVGKVDPNSDGTGEIFNSYSGSFANKATGEHSHAEGSKTTASGNFSHAEGASNTASGTYSHVEGSSNRAEGTYSHAEGNANTATGRASHAEGYNNNATGDYSHVEGRGTEAFSEGEHAEGSYNKSYSSKNSSIRVIHSVGIGSSTSDEKNAHEIKFNGDHYVFNLGGFDGTNSADAQTLQEVINSKQATITAGTGLEFEGNTLNVTLDTTVFKVVSALPASPAQGDENKIHLVPAESTGANNAYTEYVWVNSTWEILGEYTSEVDLTPYLKTVDAANTYLSKTDAASTYLSKTDASSTYLNKTDAASTYQPAGDYATSTELTEGLAGKQDVGSYATTTQLETLQTEVNSKADSALLPTYTTVPELTADYNIPANATTVEKVYDITVGATLYNITYADGIKWVNDVAPITRANHRYVVSIINNLGVWGEF